MLNNPLNNPESLDPVNEGLQRLTAVPREAFERAISNSKDVAHSLIMTVEDSQIALSWAVREAMAKLEIGVYELHERTGLGCEFIDAILEGVADISDSEPISKLERALQVRLNHL